MEDNEIDLDNAPSAEELSELIYSARVNAFLILKQKIEAGGASASDFTALKALATEVEAMLPTRAGDTSKKAAEKIAEGAKAKYEAEDLTDYDPTSPLLTVVGE